MIFCASFHFQSVHQPAVIPSGAKNVFLHADWLTG
jgi:hypothetical protein